MNKVITIGREFGSGGRELGRRLAETLGIAYYDQEIVTEIAKRTELSEHYVRQIVEHRPITSFPIHTGRSLYQFPNAVLDQNMSIYQKQHEIIQEMAQTSDCVIVGRCADYILYDRRPFRLFVYAEMESKIQRCREKAPDGEKLSDRELKQQILQVDKHRARYYSFYTGQNWGDKRNYDLCINTTHMVIKEMVPILARLF